MFGKLRDECKLYYEVAGGPYEGGMNGRYTFNEYLYEYDPEVIFTLADIQWLKFIPPNKGNRPWVAYFPIDGDHWDDVVWNSILDKCEFPVTYSKFAQEVCKKNGYDNVKMIYHGHDPYIFKPYPMEKVQESINQNFIPRKMDPDAFLVGVVQTVNPRKNWDYWLKIFAEFVKDKDNVIAVLITDPNSQMAYTSRISLRRMIKMLGIHKKVWIPMNYHFWGGYNDLQMAEITNWFRKGCYFTVSGGEGFGLCVAPETMIHTKDGFKPIYKVEIGDKVVGIDGNYHIIEKKVSRKTNKLYKVKTFNESITVSSDHPFYTFSDNKFQWKTPTQLKKGDYICSPIEKRMETISKIDITKYVKCKYNDKYVWLEHGFSPKQKKSISYCIENYHTTKKIVEKARKYLRGELKNVKSEEVKRVASLIKDDVPSPIKYPRYIELDKDFLYFAGWFIAEGSYYKGAFELSLGINDKPYIEKILRFPRKNNISIKVIEKGNRIRIIGSSAIHGRLFNILFGKGARNKKIDPIFFHSKYAMELIVGLILGDGSTKVYECRKQRLITFSTTSLTLVRQLKRLLMSYKIYSSYKKAKDKYRLFISGDFTEILAPLLGLEEYKIDKSKSHTQVKLKDGYFLIPVKKIEKINKAQEVFDIQVKNSHSFVGEFLLLHNSQFQAMCCGAPVVALDYTTPTEFLANGRGYLIKKGDWDIIDGFERPTPDIDDAVEKLNEVYYNREKAQKVAEKGRRWASKITWNSTIPQWVRLFREVAEEIA
ncbi:hypothetical protein DRH29_02760 [candidate division Kazan bacterium]|uniref:DOD-type homing endonuclease domain-containing protein n=1 Tax=candidate division Kazan bacterium TaxID=2202143 RepID=A0A420ZCM4_UNCK3|nr:MAG: hypothetical protein DRH29_02760 [candidate division Kazan bacterium]